MYIYYMETSQSLCRLITIKLGIWEFSYGHSICREIQWPALDSVSRGPDARVGGVNVLCSFS